MSNACLQAAGSITQLILVFLSIPYRGCFGIERLDRHPLVASLIVLATGYFAGSRVSWSLFDVEPLGLIGIRLNMLSRKPV